MTQPHSSFGRSAAILTALLGLLLIGSGCERSTPVPNEADPEIAAAAAAMTSSSQTAVSVNENMDLAELFMNPMGEATRFFFEYGPDINYGSRTAEAYAGVQITPRTVFAELKGLERGRTYHWRLVAVNASGTSYSEDSALTLGEP